MAPKNKSAATAKMVSVAAAQVAAVSTSAHEDSTAAESDCDMDMEVDEAECDSGNDDDEDNENDDDGEEAEVEDDDDESDDEDEQKSASTLSNVEAPQKFVINNTRGMEDALREIGYPADTPLLACVIVNATKPLSITDEEFNDDLKREQAFQTQALEAALTARRALLAQKVPFARPADFFAEMIKSDAQMLRVRQQLVSDTKAIERSEEAKRIRTQRKFSKQVQAGVIQARQKQARDLADKVKDFKKRHRNNGAAGADDFDEDMFDVTADNDAPSRGRQRPRAAGGAPKVSRDKRNQKYGFGGKKSGQRRNSADSSADISGGFRKGGGPFGSGKKGKGGGKHKGAAQKRPGLARRKQMASSKRNK